MQSILSTLFFILAIALMVSFPILISMTMPASVGLFATIWLIRHDDEQLIEMQNAIRKLKQSK